MPVTAVFLDMDGVLVDQTKLPLEYVRLLGEVLAPALGGTVEDWGNANVVTFPRTFAIVNQAAPEMPPLEWYAWQDVVSVRAMCEELGIDPPSDEQCQRLGNAFDRHVRANHEAFFPDVASTIEELLTSYRVHFATGNPSWNVEITLERLGLVGRLGVLCGPDLIGARKRTPRFYPRLFELAGVAPSEGVVVDDSAAQLATAAALGASTVLVSTEGARNADVDAVITTIGELPRALVGLASR